MKTFRPGATIWPFFLWTLIAVVGAVVAERHALLLPRDDQHRWVYHLLFWGCMILGPLAFLAHFVRSRLTNVTVAPDQGLILSGGQRISWGSIRSVDHHASPLKGSRPLDSISDVGDAPWGCLAFSGEGCILGLGLMAAFMIIYYVLFPVLCLLSPWSPRVVVHLRSGEDLVFRDLEGDADFVSMVRQGVLSVERPFNT
jgi:hypothetical protein